VRQSNPDLHAFGIILGKPEGLYVHTDLLRPSIKLICKKYFADWPSEKLEMLVNLNELLFIKWI